MRPGLFRALATTLALIALPVSAQTADEHASHHPGAAAAPTAPAASGMPPVAPMATPAGQPVTKGLTSDAQMATPAALPGAPGMAANAPMAAAAAPGMAGGGMSGMGGMMADMMRMMMAPASPGGAATAAPAMGPGAGGGMAAAGGCMGGNCGAGAAKTPIYSSLMTLPALTPAKRAEIDALARQQISEGMARLASGAESLERTAQAGDHAAMQQSVGLMREGLDQLGAGIAAQRVLLEGKAPRNLALDWFKREMNLASPIAHDEAHALPGVSVFHLFTMALLIAFALAMVVMYFFKMRRAATLFGRLKPDSGPPPPGASPPLAGAPGPTSPASPQGNSPSSPPAPSSTPASGAPPTSARSPEGPSAALIPVAGAAPPLTANWRGQLRVGSTITETPSVKTFRLLPPLSAPGDRFIPFTFVPGQFLNLSFSIGGARMNRSYSISSSPTQREYVDLTVRREPRGAVSRHMDDLLKVGDQIEAGGPMGRFTFTGTEADSIVLISGGVGITPMMSIARYLTERSWPGDIFFIYACRAPADYIFANELAALQRVNPKLRVMVTMEHPEGTDWTGPQGRITRELLTRTVPDLASRRVHLCGPPLMMDSTKGILIELGVPPDQVKTEDFGTARPTPAAAGTSAVTMIPATGALVTFSKHNKVSRSRAGQTVLELSEELAIGIEFSCRVGTCGVCKVMMTSGEVAMAVEDGLDVGDKAKGLILACQARPMSDIAVDA